MLSFLVAKFKLPLYFRSKSAFTLRASRRSLLPKKKGNEPNHDQACNTIVSMLFACALSLSLQQFYRVHLTRQLAKDRAILFDLAFLSRMRHVSLNNTFYVM